MSRFLALCFSALTAGCSSTNTNPFAVDLSADGPPSSNPDFAQASPDLGPPGPDMAALPSDFIRVETFNSSDFHGITGDGASSLYIGTPNGYVERFSDLTKTWGEVNSGSGSTFYSIYATSVTDVWGPSLSGKLAHTIDGGDNWTVTPGTTPLYAAWGPDANDVFVVGAGGKIMETTNNGTSFTTHTSGTTANLVGIGGYSNKNLFAVGENGTIRHGTSTITGLKWSTSTSGTTQTLTGVYVLSATEAVVIGYGGTILRTTDNGTTWKAEDSGTTENLVAISGLIGGDVFAVGTKGTVLDLLVNMVWVKKQSGTTADLTGVYLDLQSKVWIVGPGGLLLRGK